MVHSGVLQLESIPAEPEGHLIFVPFGLSPREKYFYFKI